MKHRLQCLIYNQVSQRDRVMNINEIVAMTLRIVTVKMALNGLDIGLTMPYTKIPPPFGGKDEPFAFKTIKLNTYLPFWFETSKNCLTHVRT